MLTGTFLFRTRYISTYIIRRYEIVKETARYGRNVYGANTEISTYTLSPGALYVDIARKTPLQTPCRLPNCQQLRYASTATVCTGKLPLAGYTRKGSGRTQWWRDRSSTSTCQTTWTGNVQIPTLRCITEPEQCLVRWVSAGIYP